MSCQDNYITIDRSTASRSGLYATDLPGVEIDTIEQLTKEDQASRLAFYNNVIVGRAWTNLINDVSTALQGKFYIDAKLLSRETSKFSEDLNSNSGLAGVLLQFSLPKYARLHVISVGVLAAQAYDSPDATLYFHEENADGELLHEEGITIAQGRSTAYIDQDFEVDKLFIGYDPGELSLRQTENKHYNSGYIQWDKLSCTFECAGGMFQGSVSQINGGGLNVKYNIVCSIEKFVCENINLFKTALWYRIGVELMDEALLGNKLNKYTTLTEERKLERSGYFGDKYTKAITEAVKAQNVREDPVCFICKNTVSSKTILP